MKLIEKLKNILKTSRLKLYKFPCTNCIVLPGGCSEICDKVEKNNNKIKELFLKYQCCIDCGSDKFFEGPCGGMSQNITCAKCNHKFNISLPLFMERI